MSLFRPLLLVLVLALAGPVGVVGAGSFPVAAALDEPPRPNVVLVMTDDMSARDLRWMPRTRRAVGSRGATFDEGISSNPMCCPARATLLTGSESHNNGVWSNTQPHGGYAGLRPGSRLPEWLQEAGYRTAFVGKHLNGFRADEAATEPGWDVLDALVGGVYSYRRYTSWNDGEPMRVRGGYVTDHLRDSAARVVERFEAEDETPFFLWVSHVGPHNARRNRCASECWTPPRPARADRGSFTGVRVPTRRLSSYNRRNDETRPPFLRSLPRVPRAELDRLHQARVETLQSIDRSVAGLVRTLRLAGELEHTVFVFTSDNGYLLGQHRYVGKRLAYEDSVKVPLLVRGPGIPAGSTIEGVATTSDLSRTIVDLAGATPPVPLDGTSLVPSFTHGTTARRGTILQTGASLAGEGDGELGEPPSTRGWLYRGYRDERWTYVRYPDPSGPATPSFEELYDRASDPFELVNLTEVPAYAGVLAELRHRARQLERCVGASCVPDWGSVGGPSGG